MLINDKYGVSFSDFINKCRVEAFIACLNDPRFAHYTLHGLALEVGFNSKSAFNAAFKKITGKTPSAFKKREISRIDKKSVRFHNSGRLFKRFA